MARAAGEPVLFLWAFDFMSMKCVSDWQLKAEDEEEAWYIGSDEQTSMMSPGEQKYSWTFGQGKQTITCKLNMSGVHLDSA